MTGGPNRPDAVERTLTRVGSALRGPHYCDYTWVLPAARALREQVEWDLLIERTSHSPYAEAFLLLADRLQIAPGIHRRIRQRG